MRMWMIDPANLCDKHLLAEHVELHMATGSIIKGRSIRGFLKKGLLDPSSIQKRHAQLVEEMQKRGFNHKTPLHLKSDIKCDINISANYTELINRCPDCKKRIIDGAQKCFRK